LYIRAHEVLRVFLQHFVYIVQELVELGLQFVTLLGCRRKFFDGLLGLTGRLAPLLLPF